MRKLVGIACAAVLMTAVGCGGKTETPTPGAVAPTPTPTAVSSAPDPYVEYEANAPKGEPKLSREDAQLRAKLGCGKAYAPGTVDAVLQKAYAAYC